MITLLCVLVSLVTFTAAKQPPHIILIVADDLVSAVVGVCVWVCVCARLCLHTWVNLRSTLLHNLNSQFV